MCTSPFSCQNIERMDYIKLEISKESHTGRSIKLEVDISERRNFSSQEDIHTVLTICQTTLQERLGTLDQRCLNMHTSDPLFKSKSQVCITVRTG